MKNNLAFTYKLNIEYLIKYNVLFKYVNIFYCKYALKIIYINIYIYSYCSYVYIYIIYL